MPVPGVHEVSSYGPLHMIFPAAEPSLPPARWANRFSCTMPTKVAISNRNRLSGCLNFTVTWSGPVAVMDLTFAYRKATAVEGDAECCRLQTTSAEVIGDPSQNSTPLLRLNTKVSGFGWRYAATLGLIE